jgi:hypothetical protein
MDFQKLLEPYSEDGLRTTAGQIKWLQSKGVPQEKIDQAILHVYDEMERGRTFETGEALDHYLLQCARDFHRNDYEAHARSLETFFNTFKDQWRQELTAQGKPTLWQRIKAVFGR